MALWQEIEIEPRNKKILIAFAGTGLVIMGVGGIFALLMLLVRTPALSVLPASVYYQSLTGHGILMFVFWLSFIQTGFLIAAGTVLIKRKLWSYPLAWIAWAVMVLATILALAGILRGASITYSGAVPLAQQFSAAWLVYLSFLLLTFGMLLIVADFIMTILGAVKRKLSFSSWTQFLKDVPISTFAAISALLIVVPGLIASFKVFIPAFLWSLGIGDLDPNLYRLTWHIAFHIYHYIPALALVGVAYVLVELTAGAQSVYAKQVAKALFLLYPFFVPPTFIYHLLVDPNLSYNTKFIGSTLSLLVGVPTVLHMFVILGMLEVKMRRAGYGLFSWLKHLPWSNPAFGSMIMGMVTLFVGGLLAYTLIQAQLAPMLHNTFMVPAYIHPMAAGGANIMYMGALYYAMPALLGRQLWGMRIARFQPYLMGLSLLIMSAFGAGAGLAGVPRRYALLGDSTGSWGPLMNISLGIGGLLAFLAGIVFVLVMGMTAIAGKKANSLEEAVKGLESPPSPVKTNYNRTPVAMLPSSIFIVLILVFSLIAFNLIWGMPVRMEVR